MKRSGLLALVSVLLLGACATSRTQSEARYSVVPKVQVTVKDAKKTTAQVSYKARPAEAPLTGSGGSNR